jgi:hypothetical protein
MLTTRDHDRPPSLRGPPLAFWLLRVPRLRQTWRHAGTRAIALPVQPSLAGLLSLQAPGRKRPPMARRRGQISRERQTDTALRQEFLGRTETDDGYVRDRSGLALCPCGSPLFVDLAARKAALASRATDDSPAESPSASDHDEDDGSSEDEPLAQRVSAGPCQGSWGN